MRQPGKVQVHQVRKLANLTTGRATARVGNLMATKRRKTLVVCPACHDAIHARNPREPTA